jgi:[acyl-carrier-protein] S-malonyltransferase
MASAAAAFQTTLDEIVFNAAQVPVLSNVDPTPSVDEAVLKTRLSQQMTSSVRWREISLRLPEEGVSRVVEIGPGKVLTGVIKRTCPNLTLENIGSVAELPQP